MGDDEVTTLTAAVRAHRQLTELSLTCQNKTTGVIVAAVPDGMHPLLCVSVSVSVCVN